jgi:hypothetical protein
MNLGEEVEVRVGEKTWRLGRLTVDVILGFRDWVAEQVGDPYAAAERVLPHLPKEDAVAAVKEAEATAKQLRQFSMQSPLAQSWAGTELGGAKLFQLMLRANHPAATHDDGLAVVMELGRKRMVEATLAKAQGDARGGSAGNPSAPAESPSRPRRGLKPG